MLKVEALSMNIGVAVQGVDLSKPVPPDVGAELHRLFSENCILLIRGQSLTQDTLGAAASWIGPLEKRGRPVDVLRETSQ